MPLHTVARPRALPHERTRAGILSRPFPLSPGAPAQRGQSPIRWCSCHAPRCVPSPPAKSQRPRKKSLLRPKPSAFFERDCATGLRVQSPACSLGHLGYRPLWLIARCATPCKVVQAHCTGGEEEALGNDPKGHIFLKGPSCALWRLYALTVCPKLKNGLRPCRKPLYLLVGTTGFEPATPCSQGRCATRLRYVPVGPWALAVAYGGQIVESVSWRKEKGWTSARRS